MKFMRVVPVAAIVAIGFASGLSPSGAQSSHSAASEGVYTAGQAAAGAKLYATSCSACHGANLHGVAGPALIGDAFTSQWTGEPASDAYEMMAKNMPLSAPGSLSQAQSLALMAFILRENKYPAGPAPLTDAKLKNVTIVSPPT